MDDLTPATEALRDVLRALRRKGDVAALTPAVRGWGIAARRSGLPLKEAVDRFRRLFDDTHRPAPGDVLHDLRRSRLEGVLLREYVEPSECGA